MCDIILYSFNNLFECCFSSLPKLQRGRMAKKGGGGKLDDLMLAYTDLSAPAKSSGLYAMNDVCQSF